VGLFNGRAKLHDLGKDPRDGSLSVFQTSLLGVFDSPKIDPNNPIDKRLLHFIKEFHSLSSKSAEQNLGQYECSFSDSGLGGLIFAIDVAKELKKMPELIALIQRKEVGIIMRHIGDISFAPYGNKTTPSLSKLAASLGIGMELLRIASGLSYIACNTASSMLMDGRSDALKALGFPTPLIQIINQSAEALYEKAMNRICLDPTGKAVMHIVVFATHHVANNMQVYQKVLHDLHKKTIWSGEKPELHVHACGPQSWVASIEEGKKPEVIEKLVVNDVREFLNILPAYVRANGKITVGLFCTHYPYVEGDMRKAFEIYPALSDVPMLSQGKIFAKPTADNLLNVLKNAPDRKEWLTHKAAEELLEGLLKIHSHVTGDPSATLQALDHIKLGDHVRQVINEPRLQTPNEV
jgi:glutamate racemase